MNSCPARSAVVFGVGRSHGLGAALALRSGRAARVLGRQNPSEVRAGGGRRFIVDLESGKPTCHLGKALSVLSALGLSLHLASRGDDLP